MFKKTNDGVHFSFENGYTVSVQWVNKNSPTAEIAVWDKRGEWVTREVWEMWVTREVWGMWGKGTPEDNVIRNLSAEDVAYVMYFVKNF